MRVAIRTDAAPHIGTGHFMRCLTLADTLCRHGGHVLFASRHLSAHLREMLLKRGYGLRMLESAPVAGDGDLAHSSWLGTTQDADAADTRDTLQGQTWDWVVVDSYSLDARWERAVRPAARRLMAIDDMADRRHACDLLLDQNLIVGYETRYAGLVDGDCTQLLGPRHALLRAEFARLRDTVRVRSGVGRVLILLGGADAANDTEKAVAAVAAVAPSAAVDVVIGADHPARARIARRCELRGYACHVQAAHIAELMAAADLAIGATGSTSWERCCLGLPTVVMTSAENQVPIARGLEAVGAVLNLGPASAVSRDLLADAVAALIRDRNRLAAMSRAAWEVTDGRGASRVEDAMIA